uniref:Salivary apyrase n=1 Tax=Sergentomyia schwetzi TaxID=114605 RepID=A0A6B9VJV0_9DIPT|nr:salivary apyrase [Sergentomyia schwetzi]
MEILVFQVVITVFTLIGLTLTAPTGSIFYNFGILADLDKDAIVKGTPGTYSSILKFGQLQYVNGKYEFYVNHMGSPIKTHFAYGGRGAELSELVKFNNKYYTVCDKTGIVFELDNYGYLIPWAILATGNGNQERGFKAEWATVKDNKLYVGSTSIEFRDPKKGVNADSSWVKVIDDKNVVTHKSWKVYYDKVRKAMKIPDTGYIWHESVIWSEKNRQWVMVPRKCTKEPFSEETNEKIGCNKIILADENFNNIKIVKIKDQPLHPAAGFSSSKFLPGSDDKIIVALRTVENDRETPTYVLIFDLEGNVLMKERKIESRKFESIEFYMPDSYK